MQAENVEEWNALLQNVSAKLFDGVDDPNNNCLDFYQEPALDEKIRTERWFGRPGAEVSQIEAAEKQLGTRLPKSYRQFLQASNGWYNCFMFPTGLSDLLPVEEIEWCKTSSWKRSIAGVVDEELGLDPNVWKGVDIVEVVLVVGVSDGNDFILLNPVPGSWEVATWEREVGGQVFENFDAFMRRGLTWI